MYRAIASLLLIVLVASCAPSSATAPSNYSTIAKGLGRDSDVATGKNEEALAALAKGDLQNAEQSARAALAADVTFGPAHNTLGMIYYRQSQLYLAAWEFQYAIKLMPAHAEGYNNLGLVLEAGGKLDQAAASYQLALKLSPDQEQFVGNLARVRLRQGDRGDETRQLLRRVAANDTRQDWAQWAREQLSLMRVIPAPETRPTP